MSHDGHGGAQDADDPAKAMAAAGSPSPRRTRKAQAFFDNGMQLAHAFAHKAATEAMEEAVRLDPIARCACGARPGRRARRSISARAKTRSPSWPSLRTRPPTSPRGTGPTASAHSSTHCSCATRTAAAASPAISTSPGRWPALAGRYPDDKEIAVIAADAWLMTKAENAEEWKLNAGLAMPLLEGVLKRDPNDTPAIHFYIHATEIAGVPAKAEAYADRLAALAPKASHLVHMPSHTYYWVGRYEDARQGEHARGRAWDRECQAARPAAARRRLGPALPLAQRHLRPRRSARSRRRGHRAGAGSAARRCGRRSVPKERPTPR